MLVSKLYSTQRQLCHNISNNLLTNSVGVRAIWDTIYKRDAVAVFDEVHANFLTLLFIGCNFNESFLYFETGFEVLVAKLDCHSSKKLALPESPIAVLSIKNTNTDWNQGVSVLSTTLPESSTLKSVSTASEISANANATSREMWILLVRNVVFRLILWGLTELVNPGDKSQ